MQWTQYQLLNNQPNSAWQLFLLLDVRITTKDGKNAFHVPISSNISNLRGMILFLRKLGIDIDRREINRQKSPLMEAITIGKDEATKALLEPLTNDAGTPLPVANINPPTIGGITALRALANNNHLENDKKYTTATVLFQHLSTDHAKTDPAVIPEGIPAEIPDYAQALWRATQDWHNNKQPAV